MLFCPWAQNLIWNKIEKGEKLYGSVFQELWSSWDVVLLLPTFLAPHSCCFLTQHRPVQRAWVLTYVTSKGDIIVFLNWAPNLITLGYLLMKVSFWWKISRPIYISGKQNPRWKRRGMLLVGWMLVAWATAFAISDLSWGMKLDANAEGRENIISDLLNFPASCRSTLTDGAGGNPSVWADFI